MLHVVLCEAPQDPPGVGGPASQAGRECDACVLWLCRMALCRRAQR